MASVRAVQHALLNYMTDPARFNVEAPHVDAALKGVDLRAASALATLSFQKRMQKIESVLPATFARLRGAHGIRGLDFISKYRPVSSTYIDNAEQYLQFLDWRIETGEVPAYFSDLANLEMRIARIRNTEPPKASETIPQRSLTLRSSVRIGACCAVMKLHHDVRGCLGATVVGSDVRPRELCLAISKASLTSEVRLHEVEDALYELALNEGTTTVAKLSVYSLQQVRKLVSLGILAHAV